MAIQSLLVYALHYTNIHPQSTHVHTSSSNPTPNTSTHKCAHLHPHTPQHSHILISNIHVYILFPYVQPYICINPCIHIPSYTHTPLTMLTSTPHHTVIHLQSYTYLACLPDTNITKWKFTPSPVHVHLYCWRDTLLIILLIVAQKMYSMTRIPGFLCRFHMP